MLTNEEIKIVNRTIDEWLVQNVDIRSLAAEFGYYFYDDSKDKLSLLMGFIKDFSESLMKLEKRIDKLEADTRAMEEIIRSNE